MPTRAQYAATTSAGRRIRSPASTTTGERPVSSDTAVKISCSDSNPIFSTGADGFIA